MKNRVLALGVLFMLFCIIPISYAQKYYADVIINVHEDGKIDISGSSNHPLFAPVSNSEDFTVKEKNSGLSILLRKKPLDNT